MAHGAHAQEEVAPARFTHSSHTTPHRPAPQRDGWRSALQQPTHRAAMSDAVRCDARCTALRHLGRNDEGKGGIPRKPKDGPPDEAVKCGHRTEIQHDDGMSEANTHLHDKAAPSPSAQCQTNEERLHCPKRSNAASLTICGQSPSTASCHWLTGHKTQSYSTVLVATTTALTVPPRLV